MKNIVFHPEAERELEYSAQYYELKSKGLGFRFCLKWKRDWFVSPTVPRSGRLWFIGRFGVIFCIIFLTPSFTRTIRILFLFCRSCIFRGGRVIGAVEGHKRIAGRESPTRRIFSCGPLRLSNALRLKRFVESLLSASSPPSISSIS